MQISLLHLRNATCVFQHGLRCSYDYYDAHKEALTCNNLLAATDVPKISETLCVRLLPRLLAGIS